MAQEVEVHVEDGVARITLRAPGRRNALTASMAQELIEAAEQVDADPTVGAVVITAEGPAFCAGADRAALAAIGENPAEPGRYRALGHVYEAFSRVQRIAAPTIAAVRGAAVGAGMNLALSTDLRIVATDAKLNPGFLPIGAHPGGGHFTLLARQAGREAAVAMSVFSVPIDGARAVALGLAWEALAAEDVEPRAFALARSIAGDPELSREAIATFRAEVAPGVEDVARGLALERAPQMWSLHRRVARV
jgi:enoyl-CoA hydratase